MDIALKELQNYKRKLFLCSPEKSAPKIGENTTTIFEPFFFFIIILHFFTSNQLSTDRKLNLPLTSSVYFVFFALEMQKRLKQSKIYHKFSHFVWKETTHKPLKVPAPRTLFFSVYVIATTCFDQCFYSVWYLKDIAFHESLSFLRYCFKQHVAAFFEATVL